MFQLNRTRFPSDHFRQFHGLKPHIPYIYQKPQFNNLVVAKPSVEQIIEKGISTYLRNNTQTEEILDKYIRGYIKQIIADNDNKPFFEEIKKYANSDIQTLKDHVKKLKTFNLYLTVANISTMFVLLVLMGKK